MSSLVINGDTSGSVTLAAPAVAGSSTITLPTTGGTMRTTTTPGTVLQVVAAISNNTPVNTSSASFVTSNLTATITPTSSTSKILVTITGGDFDTKTTGFQIYGTIYRNSTNLGNGSNGMTDCYSAGGRLITPVSLQYLDSPATTSATTYTLYFYGSGNAVAYNSQGGMGVITLMEIAA